MTQSLYYQELKSTFDKHKLFVISHLQRFTGVLN